ncbi:MFS transporter [Altericroceibacterium spongiae]|uniref:MFS transporter n=2 Tax=Altericroceibacterium spongiae TaxID=2320269 RepID=A0A420EQ53_9SPHN|nr:MFS transporter [Altericroceibacterium spongiae]
MNVRQWIVVILMIMLNALDGFDVLSSAFAAPGISAEWGIPRSELGVVLSAELVGMGVGSVLLGGMADRFGRKLSMLGCLLVMAVGMYFAHSAGGVATLTVWRLLTGIGIGGMLAATNAVVAETTSKSSRSIAMALYVIGYPLGGVIGGFAAQMWLLEVYDWRAVFLFGAVVTAVMIPLVALLMPETPAYYAARRPANAVEKINHALRIFGKQLIAQLPEISPTAAKPKVSDILTNPRLRPVTLMLAFGYMFHTITFYFILKWAVKIVADSGFSQPDAASTLTYANIGGAIGGLLFGFLMKRWHIRAPTVAMLALGAVAVTAFGFGQDSLWGWRMTAFFAMFTTNAAIVGFYSAFALGFPAYARATGTGFVLGIGRLGAASSPIIAGLLFDALGNDQLLPVSAIMAMGSVAALILFLLLPLRDADADVGDKPTDPNVPV